jgi:hypothetical protein
MIIARDCWDTKPHRWHVWTVRWQRYLCLGG